MVSSIAIYCKTYFYHWQHDKAENKLSISLELILFFEDKWDRRWLYLLRAIRKGSHVYIFAYTLDIHICAITYTEKYKHTKYIHICMTTYLFTDVNEWIYIYIYIYISVYQCEWVPYGSMKRIKAKLNISIWSKKSSWFQKPYSKWQENERKGLWRKW